MPGKNPHTGAPQGVLRPFPPGSNGGVHRGPDRYPRVTQGVMFKAMLRPSQLVIIDPNGRRTRSRKKVAAAMVENLSRRIAEIAISGRNEDILRLIALIAKVFPQPPVLKNGNGHGGLMTTHFIPPERRAPAAAAEEPTREPGSGIVMDGKEYVE
ncbi:MAG TPA: hypothetical protein VE201_05620 [Nitrospirales bacterium]|nr:hypothetical protein [Nitrospirales bacterium]